MGLESLCLRIIGGDEKALIALLADVRIRKLINSKVRSILNKNPDLNRGDLVAAACTIIWKEIYERYKPAENKEKSDNLVMSFLSSCLYGRLLNEVKQLKQLADTPSGLQRKIHKVSLHVDSDKDTQAVIDVLEDTSMRADDQMIYKATLRQLDKTVAIALKNGTLSLADLIAFQLRTQHDMPILEICDVIEQQFRLTKSPNTLRRAIQVVADKLRKML